MPKNVKNGAVCAFVTSILLQNIKNKPGSAQVGAISKAQKYQKDFQESIYSTRKSKKQKKWTEWRAKIVRPFGEKQIFEKKSHNAEKLKDDPLGFFNIHSVAKHQKIKEEKIFIFGKKSHGAKNLKGEPFGIFQHPF